ncbi:hypothetical protein GCM10027447_18780 [Glycomyces halotolerans]
MTLHLGRWERFADRWALTTGELDANFPESGCNFRLSRPSPRRPLSDGPSLVRISGNTVALATDDTRNEAQ